MKLGLTGGIGSGKSTVAAILAELGARIIDADALAHEVVAVGTPGLARVVERFGPDVLGPDGALDRPKLGRLVFADPEALADLNKIVHPLVEQRIAELAAAAGPDDVVVYDVPLMAEVGSGSNFDAVIVVETDLQVRLERLERRGIGRADATARMAQQATDEQRRAIATVVLDNSGSLEQLREQAVDALRKLTGDAVERT